MCLGRCLSAWFPFCSEDRKRRKQHRSQRDSRGHRRSKRRSNAQRNHSRSSLRSSLRKSRTVEDLDNTIEELGLPGLNHRRSNLSISKNSSTLSHHIPNLHEQGHSVTNNNQNTRSSRISKTQGNDILPKTKKSEQELRLIRDSRRTRTFTEEIAKACPPRLAEEVVLEDLCASYGIESSRGGANIESEEKVQLLKHIKRRSQMETTNEEELEKRTSQLSRELQIIEISKTKRAQKCCYKCFDTSIL